MKWTILPSGGNLLLVAASLASGCAIQCGATPERLAALRRGMSYDETAKIMGCPGTVVSSQSPSSGEYATVEWDGPVLPLSKRTQVDFLEGRLLSYTTEQRGGW